jgi:NAD(P)-dependent dehydrogenase (short-subunit alcohol dehydrogenase family)
MFRLDGKVAIVTGGGSGIGQAIAVLFGEQGAKVGVVDVQEPAAQETAGRITAAGGSAAPFRCDVTNAAEVDATFDAVAAELGVPRILVNNAGIAHVGTVETTTEADYDRVMQVNVKGAFLCAKAGVRHFLASGGGVIVNMSSIASLIGVPERFAYSVSKGAIHAMTYSIAVDYMKKNIRCNAICPARIHTPFVDGFIKKSYAGREAETLQKLSEYQPIGRMGKPEEVAALALYLCSDEASFITGQAFPIDGGVLVT